MVAPAGKKRARGDDGDAEKSKSPHAHHAHDDNDAAAAGLSIKNKKTKLRESGDAADNNNNTSTPPDSIVWPPTVSAIKTVLFTEEEEQEQENEASSLLPDDVITSSVSLLEKAKPILDKLDKENPQQMHNHKMWCACALFVCKKHHHKQTPSMDIMTLSQILKKFGIPVVDFFATMPTFLAETKMIMTHDDVSDNNNNNDDSNDNNSSSALHFPEAAHEDPFGTKELRQRFVVDIALSKKNRDLVHSLFASDARDALREFAWLLFLVVRVRAFGADTFVSIVDSFELMMATMAYLLAHATSTHLTDTAVTTLSGDASAETNDAVALLCNHLGANKESVAARMSIVNGAMEDAVKEAAAAAADDDSDTFDAIKLDDDAKPLGPFHAGLKAHFVGDKTNLLDAKRVVRVLSTQYAKCHLEVDERVFVTGEALGTPSRGGGGVAGTPARASSHGSGHLARAFDSITPQTPHSHANALLRSPAPTTGALTQTAYRAAVRASGFDTPIRHGMAGASGVLGTPIATSSRIPGTVPDTPISVALDATRWLKEKARLFLPPPRKEFASTWPDSVAEILGQEAVRRCAEMAARCADIVFPLHGEGDGAQHQQPTGGGESALMVLTLAASANEEKQSRLSQMRYSRRTEALALFWLVYERVIQSTPTAKSSTVLQKGLLACSLELVADAYKEPGMPFPAICSRIDVTPLDFSRGVDIFAMHLRSELPRSLKTHLCLCEETVLESLAWQRDSNLYELLVGCRAGAGTAPMDVANANAQGASNSNNNDAAAAATTTTGTAAPTTGAFQPFHGGGGGNAIAGISGNAGVESPAGDEMHMPTHIGMPNASGDQSRGSSHPSYEPVLLQFVRKVFKLCSLRCYDLCQRLRLPEEYVLRAATVLEYALYEQTHLLYNRHVDQLVLCTIYGVCKVKNCRNVNGDAVQFRDILYHYRRMSPNRHEVFRAVVLDQHTGYRFRDRTTSSGIVANFRVLRRDDIIKFYNRIFVPAVRRFLLNFVDNGTAVQPSGTPQVASGADAELRSRVATAAAAAAAAPATPLHHRTPAHGAGVGGSDVPASPASPSRVFGLRSPRKPQGQNVYVSNLRHGRADALVMTPRSRSMYAFVGEAIQAFQSPSRDLMGINARVTGGREVHDD
ncbi:retinoblastoma-related protein [Pseudoscourfieldia marina]